MESVKRATFKIGNLINRGHIEHIIDTVFHFHTDRSEHTRTYGYS